MKTKFSILNIVAILVLAFSCCNTSSHRRYGKPTGGFGRHNNAFEGQQSQYPNFPVPGSNQLEYGGLGQSTTNSDEGDIQQVSLTDDEDFSSLIQRPTTERNEDEIPPRYSVTTEPPASTEPPEAVTPKGTFIGKTETIDGKRVYAFYGVRFAKPPTGSLRFKRPEPLGPMTAPVDATHLPNTCPQTLPDIFNGFSGEQMWIPNTNMSEDCLYLNIWVPETVFDQRESKLSPTFFWIHGGGFFSGSISLDVYNGAELAASQGIVVVNVQYRLGSLGFLYLEPGQGNMGLLDQSLGLQWVYQNIEYFGGDPNLITVAGESCGAASVGFHLVSPLSKSYIKRGMLASGVPNARYALKSAEEMKANSIQLAKYAGCDQKTTKEILECLRNVDSDKLNTLQWKLYKHMLEFPFTPIIDGYFLPEHPDTLIKKGKAKRADLITGTTRDEGTYFILYHYINFFSHLKPTSVTYDRFVDIMQELFYNYSEAERDAIIDQYTNWENPEDGYANQHKIGEAVGDAAFICPQRKFGDNWANRGLGVYHYHFSERFSFNPWAQWMGVMHGDDIPLLFGVHGKETVTDQEQELIKNFMKMIGNFVTNGVPSPTWERYTSEHPVYLDVNATTVSSSSTPNLHGPNAKTCSFWNKLLPLVKSTVECNNGKHPQTQGAETVSLPTPATPQKYRNPESPSAGQGEGTMNSNFHCPTYPQHQIYCSAPYLQPVQQYSLPPQCQMIHQNRHRTSETYGGAAPTTEAPLTTSTSTSCKCTVEEESTTTNPDDHASEGVYHGFGTPPPAFY